jgi:tRNA U34 5-carboxymethylaminomethyl modifying GTPase MnmE/TrmE
MNDLNSNRENSRSGSYSLRGCQIVGKTTTEDLLDTIFSQFCIGNES